MLSGIFPCGIQQLFFDQKGNVFQEKYLPTITIRSHAFCVKPVLQLSEKSPSLTKDGLSTYKKTFPNIAGVL